jgi:hypothetical protein
MLVGCHVPFTEECLIKAWLVECCRDGCPSGRFSLLHRGTLEGYWGAKEQKNNMGMK